VPPGYLCSNILRGSASSRLSGKADSPHRTRHEYPALFIHSFIDLLTRLLGVASSACSSAKRARHDISSAPS
jgi:hypothetical protein